MSQAYAFEGEAGATGYHTHQHFTGTRLRYWPDCGLEVPTKLFEYHCMHLHGLLAFLHFKGENWEQHGIRRYLRTIDNKKIVCLSYLLSYMLSSLSAVAKSVIAAWASRGRGIISATSHSARHLPPPHPH